MALLAKGMALDQLGQSEEGVKVYDQVVDRFGSSELPALQEQVAMALNGKGFTLLISAKADVAQRDPQPIWQQAAALFEQALPICAQENRAITLGNLAYASWLLGEHDLGSQRMVEALMLGGETLYQGTLDDIARHALLQDKANADRLAACWTAVKGCQGGVRKIKCEARR